MRLAVAPSALAALVVLATGSFAGEATTLVRVGDFVPGFGTITSLGARVAVDDSGSWWVQASSGPSSAVLSDGQVVLLVGSAVADPPGATITAIRSFGVSRTGQPAWTVDLSTGAGAVYWGSGLALRTGTTPLAQWPTGSTYASFRHAQPVGSSSFLLLGSVDDPNQGPVDFVSTITVNAGGQAISESLTIRNGSIAGSMVVDSVPVRPEQLALAGSGFSSGALYTIVASGSSRLVRTTPFCSVLDACSILFQPGSTSPSGASMGDLYGAGLDANPAGAWVAKFRAGSPSTVRICANLGSATTEPYGPGVAIPAIAPWTIESILFDAPIFLPESGQIVWHCNWNDPATTRDEGILRDGSLIVQEGVTTSGGTVIETLDPYGLAVCESGRYLVFRGRLAGGVEGAFRIDLVPPAPFCFGDGTGTPCPCANSSAPGEARGCLNSFGTGARLTATGLASVSSDTVTLHCIDMSPTGQSPTFFQGTAQSNNGLGAAFGDGLRCAVGTTIRLGTNPSVNGALDFGYGSGWSPLVHVAGLVGSGAVRHYQVLYRNAAPTFCTSATFNTSNGLTISWSP